MSVFLDSAGGRAHPPRPPVSARAVIRLLGFGAPVLPGAVPRFRESGAAARARRDAALEGRSGARQPYSDSPAASRASCLVLARERGLFAVSNRDQPRASSLHLDAVPPSRVCDVLCDQETVLDLCWPIDDLDPTSSHASRNRCANARISSCPRYTPASGPREFDQSNTASGAQLATIPSRSRRLYASVDRRTISTFSCDIAGSVSRSSLAGPTTRFGVVLHFEVPALTSMVVGQPPISRADVSDPGDPMMCRRWSYPPRS